MKYTKYKLSHLFWTMGILFAAYISLSPMHTDRKISQEGQRSIASQISYLGLPYVDPLYLAGSLSNHPYYQKRFYSNANNDVLSPYNPYLLYPRSAQLTREVNLLPGLNWDALVSADSETGIQNPANLGVYQDKFYTNLMKIMDAASFESQVRRQTFGLLERERSPMNSVLINLNASQPASFVKNPSAIAWGDEIKFRGAPISSSPRENRVPARESNIIVVPAVMPAVESMPSTNQIAL